MPPNCGLPAGGSHQGQAHRCTLHIDPFPGLGIVGPAGYDCGSVVAGWVKNRRAEGVSRAATATVALITPPIVAATTMRWGSLPDSWANLTQIARFTRAAGTQRASITYMASRTVLDVSVGVWNRVRACHSFSRGRSLVRCVRKGKCWSGAACGSGRGVPSGRGGRRVSSGGAAAAGAGVCDRAAGAGSDAALAGQTSAGMCRGCAMTSASTSSSTSGTTRGAARGRGDPVLGRRVGVGGERPVVVSVRPRPHAGEQYCAAPSTPAASDPGTAGAGSCPVIGANR
ncbi:Uncharacterised protein [Actinomadura madurae]|nr:Uncharacterised protein [Actinomadura madurae]